jgi:hypothetical protein
MQKWVAHAIASHGPSLDERWVGDVTAGVAGDLPAFIAAAATAARELADEQLAEEFLDALAAVNIDRVLGKTVFY